MIIWSHFAVFIKEFLDFCEDAYLHGQRDCGDGMGSYLGNKPVHAGVLRTGIEVFEAWRAHFFVPAALFKLQPHVVFQLFLDARFDQYFCKWSFVNPIKINYLNKIIINENKSIYSEQSIMNKCLWIILIFYYYYYYLFLFLSLSLSLIYLSLLNFLFFLFLF